MLSRTVARFRHQTPSKRGSRTNAGKVSVLDSRRNTNRPFSVVLAFSQIGLVLEHSLQIQKAKNLKIIFDGYTLSCRCR